MLKKLAFFLALFSVCSTASVKAQTIVPADDGTGTIITRDGKRITIDGGSLSQNGENLFHSFQEFGLSPEQIANFLANPQLQNILSRVTGGNPSVIRGLIEVSGGNPNLYLMNPSGVIFGENARLNVPSDFTATTATGIGFKQGWFNAIGENNYSELVGTPNQFIFNTETPSAIINAGDLEVSAENNLSFFAGSVANTGTLTAKQGNITITAVPGKNLIRLSQPGQILSLEIVPPDTTAGEWNLSVYDLPELLTGDYSPEGLVVDEATATVSLQETPIPTTEGSSVIAGELDVSGETGGNIYVLGEKIGLYEAQLSADGVNGGGEIFVGGDYQGGESLPSAARTFVSDGAELSADALITGDGGQVIVWSEGQTVFSGDISAKGGKEEGNGGLVEVSGKEALAFNGSVDVSATQGETGTVLFDPRDIRIETVGSAADDNQVSDGEILRNDEGNTDFIISNTALTDLQGNIVLEASRDIVIALDTSLNFNNQSPGNTISFTAERNIEIDAPVIDTNGANLELTANTGFIKSQGYLFTAHFPGDAGNITLRAGGSIDFSVADENAGAEEVVEEVVVELVEDGELGELDELFTIFSASEQGDGGNITLEADGDITAGFIGSFSENGSGGNITLTSTGGNVNATQTIVVEADTLSEQTEVGLFLSGSQNGDGGDVTITAQGNIRTGLIGTGSLDDGIGGNITLNSETGSIDTTVGVRNLEPAFLEELGLSRALAQAATTASVDIGLLFSGSNEGVGGDVEITAQDNINTGMIITGTLGEEGGNVTITSNEGSVNTAFDAIVDGVTEELLLEADVDAELASLLDGVSIRLGIITFSEEAKGGDVTINANGDITTSNITTGSFRGEGGNITLDSENGSIDGSESRFLENVSAELLTELDIDIDSDLMTIVDYFSEEGIGGYLSLSIDENAGDINLSADGDINTNYLIGSSFSGEGGNITLDTDNGAINISSVIFNAARGILPTNLATEDEDLSLLTELVSGGSVNSSGVSGGEIQIGDLVGETVEKAPGEVTAAAINSSGRLGDGGNQTIASDQDIEVSTLNAQAGEEGQGGVIDVSTDRFFRATETFLDQGEIPASVSSIGGEGGGEITIRHGGRGEIPFIVGDAEVNGTAGEITSGEFEIADGSFLFTEREGNISIISVEEDQPNPEVLNEEPTTTITTNTQQSVQVTTLDDAQEILAEIDRASGVKPALIYLNFTPETLTGITDFQRQEARFTQDYEQYFNLSQRKADVTLSVPRQPDDQLEILLVTESGEPFRITVENATREQVEQTAEALYGSISSPPSPFARQAKPYLAPAQQLYDWIIEPLEATLEAQKIENLVFIMPSGLRLLPVAALHDGEQFLVENYSTGFSPSLSLTDTRYKNLQDLEVFAIGASNFNDPTALGPLPAVELELPTIANEIWRGEFQINDEFTLENFRQERRRNPEGIIHLATHADFRPGNLEDIYIQLYDRKLSLEDIRQLNLNDPPVELLVLSACRTAVGNEQVELGFAGLTVQAGVKSALASLWYVGDTGTLGLMSEFYRQLNTAPIKAEAIQQAQINLINGEVRLEGSEIITPRGELTLPTEISTRAEDLSHPFYWAAFSLVGSPW
ncbi:UNVERIFIED_CONTAM: hypothetical protein BEN50_08550 [Euhalothece sp. KZN 001]